MRTLVWSIVFLAVALTTADVGSTVRPNRVAVVIGNGDYAIGPLTNPPNDATLVASAFRQLEFEVFQGENLTMPGFEAFFEGLKAGAASPDVLFVYYAGHAFQYRGGNRLLMVDATADSVDTVLAHSLSLSDLVARFSTLAPRALVFALDSCRDNPFADGGAGIESGLSYLETGDGQVMIAYATSAGKVAYDGYGSNSPYSVALSNALLEAAAAERPVTDVFRAVRREVREATNGLQIPWVSSSIEDEIVLADPDPATPATAVVTAPDGLPRLEDVLWYFAHSSGDPDDLQAYLQTFPSGTYVADARTIMDQGASASRAVFRLGDTRPARADEPAGRVVLATTGDRSPPPEIRAWPVALPASTDGLSSLAGDCDALAADPDDPGRLAPGMQMGLINVRLAVRACVAALVRDPENARAIFQLGRTLEAADLRSWGMAFYEAAADRGYSAAMVNLGFLYRNGRGVPQDDGKAFALYKRAADLGNLRARTNIGTMYRNGWGVPVSYDEALLWYRLAGSSGWPNAIDALAGMYAKGQGVEKSPEKAVELYRAAAAIGQTNAMNNLGRAYLSGEGVEKDPTAARRWLEAGAAAGNRFAAQSLGRLLKDEDPARAMDLFQLSAERGHADARIDFARLLRGRGGKGDKAEALFQIRLAEELGADRAKEVRPDFEKGVSEKDRAAVEDRVRSWMLNNGS